MGFQWEIDGIGIIKGVSLWDFDGIFHGFFGGISMGIWDLMGINRIYRDFMGIWWDIMGFNGI